MFASSVAWNGGTAATLSGESETTAAYVGVDRTLRLDAEIEIELADEDWSATATTGIEATSWDEQSFGVELGFDRFALDSTLRFEPDRHRFRDWKTEFTWENAGWDVEIESKLTRTRRWLTVDLEWTRTDHRRSGTLELGGRLRFRGVDLGNHLLFYDLRIDGETALLGVDAEFELDITPDGFDEATIDLSGLMIPRIPWLSFDLEAERTTTGRTIEIEAAVDLGEETCLWLEGGAASGPILQPLRLAEVTLESEIGPIELDAVARLDPDDWIDDVYPFTLGLSFETEIRPDRDAGAEFVLFWLGDADGRMTPGRAAATLELELTDRLDVFFELDVTRRPDGPRTILAGIEHAW